MISTSLHKTLQTANGIMPLDIELDIYPGEFVTIYGESGAGKTSILKMLAGLLTPDYGKIIVDGNTWLDTSRKINLAPQKRKIGFVFQDYALFPNMSVRKNITYALAKDQDIQIVEELIEITELGDLQHQKPNLLSGGQRQRVALARALVQQPNLLLLDEPLSALDHKMRLKLQEYLRKIHKKYQITTILVSHDIGEIVKLSNKVYLLEKGKITRQGEPLELFNLNLNDTIFEVKGEIISIENKNSQYTVMVLIGINIIKVAVQESEIKNMKIGDMVVLSSTTLNPILKPEK